MGDDVYSDDDFEDNSSDENDENDEDDCHTSHNTQNEETASNNKASEVDKMAAAASEEVKPPSWSSYSHSYLQRSQPEQPNFADTDALLSRRGLTTGKKAQKISKCK